MRTLLIALVCTFFCAIVSHSIYGQAANVVSGNIKNSQTKENLAAVSVIIKGTTTGTFTDEKGNFRLTTAQKPPFTLIISSIGYAPKEMNVESTNQALTVA